MQQIQDLPAIVQTCLSDFLRSTNEAFGDDLLSATLFGSAAEGELRPTSDVNLLLVLKKFDQRAADRISESLRIAHAAILLEVMFILESEIELAAEAFAVKFADIESRHRVIFGKDHFTTLDISVESLRLRLRQVLTNQILRLRERYVLNSPQVEQLSKIIADVAGPLRSSAVSLLKLRGRSAPSPKGALYLVAQEYGRGAWNDVVAAITKAREGSTLKAGTVQNTYFAMLELAEFMLNELNANSTTT